MVLARAVILGAIPSSPLGHSLQLFPVSFSFPFFGPYPSVFVPVRTKEHTP